MTFPNLKNKQMYDSMLSPKEFIKYGQSIGWAPKGKPPEGVIICYNGALMKRIRQKHTTRKVRAFAGDLYFLKGTKDRIGIMGNFGIGAPVAIIVLEELIAWGVKRFISIGTAGTLQKNLEIGNLVVCDRAIRDEGTSHHYTRHSKYSYASKEMTTRIKQTLNKLAQQYSIGTSWTIDSPYRETVREAKQYQKEGVATVEMEAAALFAVAEYRKISLGAIFAISDSLAELEWKPKFQSKKTSKGLEVLYKIAKETLSST